MIVIPSRFHQHTNFNIIKTALFSVTFLQHHPHMTAQHCTHRTNVARKNYNPKNKILPNSYILHIYHFSGNKHKTHHLIHSHGCSLTKNYDAIMLKVMQCPPFLVQIIIPFQRQKTSILVSNFTPLYTYCTINEPGMEVFR